MEQRKEENKKLEEGKDGREYRIQAYFTETYPPRSYKRKVFHSREEAEALYGEAKEYYSGYPYAGKLDRVVIESRAVAKWEEEEQADIR